MVSKISFWGGFGSPQKVETYLFRRLIQLSLGGLLFSRARFCFTGCDYLANHAGGCQVRFCLRPCRGSLALGLALLARRLQLAIGLGVNFQVPALQPVLGRDVTQSTVQSHRVVMLDKLCHHPSRVLQAQRCFRPACSLSVRW